MNKDEMIKEAKCHKCIHFPVCSLWTKTDLIADETHKYYCRHYANEKELSQVGDDEIVIKKQAYEKLVEEFAKQEEIAHSYEQGYTELLETNHQLQDKLEQVKKETAIEVSDKIYNKLTESDMWHDMKKIWWRFNNEFYELKEVLKKVLKELGIELE